MTNINVEDIIYRIYIKEIGFQKYQVVSEPWRVAEKQSFVYDNLTPEEMFKLVDLSDSTHYRIIPSSYAEKSVARWDDNAEGILSIYIWSKNREDGEKEILRLIKMDCEDTIEQAKDILAWINGKEAIDD